MAFEALLQKIVDTANAKPYPPHRFVTGQKVRILTRLADEGPGPGHWAGQVCVVEERHHSWLTHTPTYTLRDKCGHREKFAEEDLDLRYTRRKAEEG